MRLTDAQRADREVTGGELQGLVTELAEMYGWSWFHVRPGLRANGRWYVPVEGPLGEGWPDLTLIRDRDQRTMFVELKRELGDDLRPGQRFVLELLGAAGHEVHVWRPSDLTEGRVQEALR
jgi:hypothetical protein